MTDNQGFDLDAARVQTAKWLAELRADDHAVILSELGFHVRSGNRCLCGTWDGKDTHTEHLANAITNVLYGDPDGD